MNVWQCANCKKNNSELRDKCWCCGQHKSMVKCWNCGEWTKTDKKTCFNCIEQLTQL